MGTKKLISCLVACSMLASTAAFAAAPSKYDGQSYGSLGYTSEDPDGQFNLAVIANGDVNIYGDTMYIKGSVYSNGTIYAGNGQGNKVDGLFISGTENTVFDSDENNNEWTQHRTAEGYVHVNDNGTTDGINYYSTQIEHKGAILDKDTSFECSVNAADYAVPEIANNLGNVEANRYGYDNSQWGGANTAARTISEDTKFDELYVAGDALKIDVSNGDVTVVIDTLKVGSDTPYIDVIGTEGNSNKAYIYVNSYTGYSGEMPNLQLGVNVGDNKWDWRMFSSPADDTQAQEYLDLMGDKDRVDFHISNGDKPVILDHSKIAGNVYIDSADAQIKATAWIDGNVTTNASALNISDGATMIRGTVCAPVAATNVVNSATVYGQVHVDTLTINGAGRIIYLSDSAAEMSETPAPTEAPVPTEEPVVTPEPTLEPVPSGTPIDLKGVGYAYIFGYEPKISYVYDQEAGAGHLVAEVEMAPNDAVTREQVAAMIMRMIDQKYDTKDASYPVTDNIAAHAGTWYERGLAYVASTGAFDGIDEVNCGAITRGEVAKLVAYGLNLSDTTETSFADIADSQYKPYIEIMNAYGYMHGISDTEFEPDRVMTRAEFCSMFNQIIDRQDALLVAADGTEVTPETYYFVDLDADAWYTSVMLRATSAYDENGYVDIDTRLSNIRNTLDNYDSQKLF